MGKQFIWKSLENSIFMVFALFVLFGYSARINTRFVGFYTLRV